MSFKYYIGYPKNTKETMFTKLPVFTFLFIFSFYSGFGQAFYSASPNTLHFMTGAIPNSLTISSTVKADFNNDGRPDLAIIVANSDTARVRIFSSNCFPDLKA